MNKLKFLLLACALIFLACKGKPVEEVIEKFPDGTAKMVRYYQMDGQIKQLVKEIKYYPNHKKYYEGEFKDNHKDGKWTVWYENGVVWSEGYYKNGVDEGSREGYYDTGKKHFKGQYKNGKPAGIWKFWDENERLAQEIDYDKQKEAGKP